MLHPKIADVSATRHILNAFKLRASKKLGQNFLIDSGVVDDIVAAAEISPGEDILEIGPGIGTLTQGLLEAGAKVTAVELDKKLPAVLKETLAGYENFVGLNRYDDEGTDIKPVTLIEKGKFVNTLNSYSNYGLNNKLYGTGRRESFKYGIMPRMRFSIIKNVNHISYQQMIAQQSNAFFVNEINFGYISPQEGNYSLLGNGYIIKNGGTTTFVDNLQLTGNIFEDLKNIEQIGDDSQTFCSYCNKINQMVRVGANSPSIRLSNISKLEGIFYGKD